MQTALEFRGAGVGRALMHEVERAARDDLRLNHLHLELRGGMGLERFYESCGWWEIGSWPEALCLNGTNCATRCSCTYPRGDVIGPLAGRGRTVPLLNGFRFPLEPLAV